MKWFDRQFDFTISTAGADSICHRLRHCPAKLRELISISSPELLEIKTAQKWSVKEHIGHLSVLEPLWRSRFEDIRECKEVLTPADLENKATNNAGFNTHSITSLLDNFLKQRSLTLGLIATLNLQDENSTSMHPRLQQPMRLVDHAWFIAEHDEHHINSIREIIKLAAKLN